MTSTKITPNSDMAGTSIDLSTIDIDHALQRGRRLRAAAFTSVLKSLFRGLRVRRGHRAERDDHKGGLLPDCAAPA